MEIKDKNIKLNKYISGILPKIEKEAHGFLEFPFLSVSYGKHYANAVFTWDNFHMALRFAADGKIEYLRYLVDNLSLYQTCDNCAINYRNWKTVATNNKINRITARTPSDMTACFFNFYDVDGLIHSSKSLDLS